MLSLNASLKLTKREFKVAALADLPDNSGSPIKTQDSHHLDHRRCQQYDKRITLIFRFRVFMELNRFSVQKRKRKNKFDQYSAILTSQSVNNAYE